ncbi:hypothetical protein B566_EDAN004768 [Ephemera danica]|nr:hypothetical protein B566_EDAN004768 [Ephemera danica]
MFVKIDENKECFEFTDFINEIKKLNIPFSMKGEDRFYRGHGMAISEILNLREGDFKRIPDIVTWPNCHDDVVKLVQLASKLNVVLVPFGGGTNVTRALECSVDEKRMIVSLDTSQMKRVLWVDKANLMACCEAGIMGQDLKAALRKHKVTMGHEPDSLEFSTLGGWVATRASGMKKNRYGNIEDLVVHVKFVTPSGVLEKSNLAPRVSCGPDLNHLALGSEGTLGVVTEVTFKVKPIPEVEQFDSFVFPTFQHGVDFMREVARKVCDATDVSVSKSKIATIASKFDGFSGGSKHGERGYNLTFTIAYIRDLLLSHSVLGESFETSLPWDRVALVCRNVKTIVNEKCKEFGIKHFLASCRVPQVYDTGACVYFYLAFNGESLENAMEKYEDIEIAARDEILRCGGSLSHHHGVGKLRSNWYPSQVSPVGVAVYQAVKQALDPNNVFACGNLLPQNGDEIVHANLSNGLLCNSK